MSFENSVDLLNIFQPVDCFNTTGETIHNEELFDFDLLENCTGISSKTYEESKNFDIKVLLIPMNEMIVIPNCKIIIYDRIAVLFSNIFEYI